MTKINLQSFLLVAKIKKDTQIYFLNQNHKVLWLCSNNNFKVFFCYFSSNAYKIFLNMNFELLQVVVDYNYIYLEKQFQFLSGLKIGHLQVFMTKLKPIWIKECILCVC